MGFVHDSRFCLGCKACQMACKDRHGGDESNFRRVITVEGGGYQPQGQGYGNDVFAYSLSVSCHHCGRPRCVPACPAGAIKKDKETGIVFIDTVRCLGCGACVRSCPYGAPQIDVRRGVAGKCDFCRDLLARGEKPVCTAACPVRVLEGGPMEDLRQSYPSAVCVSGLAAEADTELSLLLCPHDGAQDSIGKALLPSGKRGL